MRKGGGSKKFGRNAAKCSQYRSVNRRYKNKLRRLKKRIKHLLPSLQERILRLNPIKQ